MKRFILFISLLVMVALPAAAVSASIASPSSYSISSVTVYSPALESADQLWVVQFSVTYGTNPSYDAGQAWLLRLLDGSNTEITSETPYAFYNSGYSTGVVSFYLPAPLAPTWSSNCTVYIEPNPTLDWTSMPTAVPFTSITWTSWTTYDEVSTALANQIIALGVVLNTAWNATSNPIIESVNGAMKLTDRGASYFDVVIPVLRNIAPDLYQSAILMPQLGQPNWGNTYQQQADNQTTNTPFDMTKLGTLFNVSRMWATGGLWGLFCLVVSGTIGYKVQSVKPVFFLFGGLMVVGGFMGFGLLQTILFVLLGAASVILAFTWRGA